MRIAPKPMTSGSGEAWGAVQLPATSMYRHSERCTPAGESKLSSTQTALKPGVLLSTWGWVAPLSGRLLPPGPLRLLGLKTWRVPSSSTRVTANGFNTDSAEGTARPSGVRPSAMPAPASIRLRCQPRPMGTASATLSAVAPGRLLAESWLLYVRRST